MGMVKKVSLLEVVTVLVLLAILATFLLPDQHADRSSSEETTNPYFNTEALKKNCIDDVGVAVAMDCLMANF